MSELLRIFQLLYCVYHDSKVTNNGYENKIEKMKEKIVDNELYQFMEII
jgi:hypothetical protein